jgi:hypothetical protein
MGFIWLSKEGKIRKGNVNEIKDNVDTIISTLNQPSIGCSLYSSETGGVTPFSWKHLSVEIGEEITDEIGLEIRNAADYINDSNYCHAVYTSVNLTDNDTNDISVDSSDDSSVCSTNNSSVDSSDNGTVDGTNYWSYCVGKNISVNSRCSCDCI